MTVNVDITSIIGNPPFNIYICQSGGTDCFYINTINTTSYNFDIPEPYNNSNSYMLKIVDNNNCIISGTSIV